VKKIVDIIKKKWLRETVLTIILICIIVATYFALNIGINKLNINPLDVTKEKLYTLSDESKELVKDIEQEVKIYFFGFDETATPYTLAKQYENVNEKITAEIINIIDRPDVAQKYGVESSSDIGIIVESGQRHKVLSTNDLYTYDTTTYETIDITEQKLTNTIIDTTIAKKPKIYFLTGHEEYNLSNEMSILKIYLENEINEVNILNLLTTEFPTDCDTLVVASPLKDFAEMEANKIIQYIQNGGNILWFSDASIEELNLPNVQRVLNEYGISSSKGMILETSSSNMLINTPYLIVPNINYHEITKDIYNETGVVFIQSGKLNIVEQEKLNELNVTVTPIIESNDTSFYRDDFSIATTNKTSSEEYASYVLGAEVVKKISEEKTSKLVIFSNGIFASDSTMPIQNQYVYAISLFNNKDLVLNSVAYLTDREDTIRIRKDTGYVTYTATQAQDNIVKIIIFVFPILIIIIGMKIRKIRRKKK